MMHKIIPAIMAVLTTLLASTAMSEAGMEKDILGVLDDFTRALDSLDAEAASAIIEPSATIILSIENADGTIRHSIRSRDEYLASWNQLGDITLKEKMWNPVTQMDGPIATVWMDYALYVNGEFRQCGKNGFNMIRQQEGWKIAGAVSSVRYTGCEQSTE